MGKKLDALLGRSFKTSKLKATVSLAISRLAVLKNQRQARCSISRSDVVEFLKNSNHERALLRVEQVIKEQNMLDVFVILEGYCHLLTERVTLLEQEKVCPEDLVEAVSTLIYAATRCGEFPELQELRGIFTSRFGKEFAARAVELRNNCGVNPKIIQKLSTRRPSLENKIKVLKEIASDNNIDLPTEETVFDTKVDVKDSGPSAALGFSDQVENESVHPDETERGPRRKYRDVADAAQAAFESAAYAAAAARAAVELSRSESTDPDDHNSPSLRPRNELSTSQLMKNKLHNDPPEDKQMKTEMKLEKIHPAVQNYEDKSALHVGKGMEESGAVYKRRFSGSSSDSFDHDNVKGGGIYSDEEGKIEQGNVVFDDSEDEDEDEDERRSWNYMEADDKNDIMEGSSRAQYGLKMEKKRSQATEPLNINRRPISVRSRWAKGQ